MIPWFKHLFTRILWEESWPERAFRTAVAFAGALVQGGVVPIPEQYNWLGSVVMALSFTIPAGQKNPKGD